jgi:hypothetical protein
MATIAQNESAPVNDILAENEVMVDLVTKLEVNDSEIQSNNTEIGKEIDPADINTKNGHKNEDSILTFDAKNKKKLDKIIGNLFYLI